MLVNPEAGADSESILSATVPVEEDSSKGAEELPKSAESKDEVDESGYDSKVEAKSADPVMDDLEISFGSPGDKMLESPLGLGHGLVPKSILQEAMDRRESVDLLATGKSPPSLLSSGGESDGDSEAEGEAEDVEEKVPENFFDKLMKSRSASLGTTSRSRIPSFGSTKRARDSPPSLPPHHKKEKPSGSQSSDQQTPA